MRYDSSQCTLKVVVGYVIMHNVYFCERLGKYVLLLPGVHY